MVNTSNKNVRNHFFIYNSQSGQAGVEYIILVSIVSLGFLSLAHGLEKMKLQEKIMTYLTKSYAVTYQYGHYKVVGFDDGGPTYHPRAEGAGNFRIFFNPESK